MKSVMISIKPKWCELIANGTKTVEVRKTRPKIETPFKCYIYCTKDFQNNKPYGYKMWAGRGKVIGEFVCDFIGEITAVEPFVFGGAKDYFLLRNNENIMSDTCLSFEEVDKYFDGVDGYGWHISDILIYDKPKELEKFYSMKKCNSCKMSGYESSACIYDDNCIVPAMITRPPQSWCYVEGVKE